MASRVRLFAAIVLISLILTLLASRSPKMPAVPALPEVFSPPVVSLNSSIGVRVQMHYNRSKLDEQPTEMDLSGKKVVLLSYGSREFKERQREFALGASKLGVFTDIIFYGPDDVIRFEPTFDPKYLRDKRYQRGGGYWMWKSLSVHQVLRDLLDEGDFIIYADAGSEWMPKERGRLMQYLHAAQASPGNILTFNLASFSHKRVYAERCWSRMAVSQAFGVPASAAYHSHPILDSPQIIAGFVIIKKSAASLDFMGKMRRMVLTHPEYFLDKELVPGDAAVTESFCFRDHRHDQTVWSHLLKTQATLGAWVFASEQDNGTLPEEFNEHAPCVFSRKRVWVNTESSNSDSSSSSSSSSCSSILCTVVMLFCILSLMVFVAWFYWSPSCAPWRALVLSF